MGSRSENILATVPGEASSVEVISGPRLAGLLGEGRRSHSRAADFETRLSVMVGEPPAGVVDYGAVVAGSQTRCPSLVEVA